MGDEGGKGRALVDVWAIIVQVGAGREACWLWLPNEQPCECRLPHHASTVPLAVKRTAPVNATTVRPTSPTECPSYPHSPPLLLPLLLLAS